jgi:hypothetical protein
MTTRAARDVAMVGRLYFEAGWEPVAIAAQINRDPGWVAATVARLRAEPGGGGPGSTPRPEPARPHPAARAADPDQLAAPADRRPAGRGGPPRGGLPGAAGVSAAVLVILACLGGGTCQRFEVPVEACTAGGQPAVLAWRMLHPDWTVRRWRCEQGTPA